MQKKSAATQSGTIIVTDPNEDLKALNFSEDDYGRTFVLDLTRGDNELEEPRKIQMDGIPSATLITLSSRNKSNGNPEWWMKLKTTHHTSKLNSNDIVYYVNTYLKDAFIKEGLGIVVVDKSRKAADHDTLGEVKVELSPRS